MAKTVTHTDRIAELKEQRIAAIHAQLPADMAEQSPARQRVLMQRAEISDDVLAINELIYAARAEHILDKHADPDDPFDDAELTRILAVIEQQNPPAAAAIHAARAKRNKEHDHGHSTH